jgi:hypothetical protein
MGIVWHGCGADLKLHLNFAKLTRLRLHVPTSRSRLLLILNLQKSHREMRRASFVTQFARSRANPTNAKPCVYTVVADRRFVVGILNYGARVSCWRQTDVTLMWVYFDACAVGAQTIRLSKCSCKSTSWIRGEFRFASEPSTDFISGTLRITDSLCESLDPRDTIQFHLMLQRTRGLFCFISLWSCYGSRIIC